MSVQNGRDIVGNAGGGIPLRAPNVIVPHATGNGRENGGLLLEYYRTLSRHRYLIYAGAAIGLAAGFLLQFRTLPVYQAQTSADVQTLNGDFMNMRSVAPTDDGVGTSTDATVQTQIKLMQSQTLLDNTLARLSGQPHAQSFEPEDFLSRWMRRLHVMGNGPIAYENLADFTAQSVKVKPVGLTRLIEVTCDSWNADFAAKFCNTLVDEFKDEDLQFRAMEGQKTSDWLSRQAEDVRLKAGDLEKQLETAVGGNGLMLSQDTNTVGEDRLRDLQEELVRAKADRMEKEAQFAVASSSSADTVSGIVSKPGYQNYQRQLADLRAQLAKISPPLKDDHPQVIHLRSQIKEAEAGLEAERTADAATMKNDYDAALHREALLSATYQSAEASVSSDLGKAARVSLLRHEVDSEQELYQTLQQHAKEAGFASAMHASTLHVVDAARAPSMPISPRRGSAEALGLLLGSLCGVGVAFFKDRNFEFLRSPGDSQRLLHVAELGVIPSAEISRNRLVLSAQKISTRLGGSAARGELPSTTALGLTRWDDSFSIMAEAYRNTTLSLMLSRAAAKRSYSYVVASPNASDGKTSVTANLGVALSRSRLRVVLVDGDLRRPALHNALQVPNQYGVRNLLRSECVVNAMTVKACCRPTSYTNLSVMTSGYGDEDAVELLHTSRLKEVVAELVNEFDVVLIDTPPLLHMADARIFAATADGVILVLRSGVTERQQALNAVELLERDRAALIGTILNDFNPSREGQGDYYRSYYRYKQETAPVAGGGEQ